MKVKKFVLIIENDDAIRENITEMLELANYGVLQAENGKKGVELALQHKPDIVLCDVMMPVMDGYSVLHVFSKHAALEAIPFIFLSARTERNDIRKGMESGADDYITKPFQESELLNAIEGRLRKASVMKKHPDGAEAYPPARLSTSRQHKVLEQLAQDKKNFHYKKKQILYAEGNDPSKLFFLKKGKVKIYTTNSDGKEYITGIFKEDDFFGYLPLIEETAYQESAETLEDSEIVVIPKEEFLTLLYHNQDIANRLIRMLANNVSEKEKMLSKLAYNSLRKRTADSLLFLHTTFRTPTEQHPSIQISRHDIGGLVGASPEAVTRTLGDFKNERIIDVVDGKIFILNEHKLQHLRN